MLQNVASDQGLYCLHTGISAENKNLKGHQAPLKWKVDFSNLLEWKSLLNIWVNSLVTVVKVTIVVKASPYQ